MGYYRLFHDRAVVVTASWVWSNPPIQNPEAAKFVCASLTFRNFIYRFGLPFFARRSHQVPPRRSESRWRPDAICFLWPWRHYVSSRRRNCVVCDFQASPPRAARLT